MNPMLEKAVAENKWSVWMMNREAEWVRIHAHKEEKICRREFKLQPRGYAFRLYDNEGILVDSKGDATYIVMG